MDNHRETAKNFWETRAEYPHFATKARRLHEINYIIPRISHAQSILDLGCGDGELLALLLRLTDIQDFHGMDFAPGLLEKVDPRVKTSSFDFYSPVVLPETDVTIIGGVLQYIFEDEVIRRGLSLVQSPLLITRGAYVQGREEIVVDKFSDHLGDNYASRYMTLPHAIDLISEQFIVQDVRRCYPDEIESQFGTKQFFITATR